MADDFVPLRVFNDQEFATCYNWTKDEILQFFRNVADHPENYGVTDEQVINDLKLLQQKIAGLTDPAEGSIYSTPLPKQQVLRKTDETKISHLALEPTKEIPWTANANKEKFYISFDLMGTFISLITSISATLEPKATAKNYFLPLVVLYTKWCYVISASKSTRPVVTQVTWFEKGEKLYPFFGASIGAYIRPAHPPEAAKDWEDTVQKARWDYLHVKDLLPGEYATFDESPLITQHGVGGTKYGNCGETYPFLYAFKGQNELAKHSYGVAIYTPRLFSKNNVYPPYNGKEIWESKAMYPPCENCQSLLAKQTIPLDNYLLFKA